MTKLGFGLLIAAIVTMVLGLILIGVTKEGFLTLKFLGVGGVLQLNGVEKRIIEDGGINIGLLQFGAVLAAIFTPILFISSLAAFGYNFWKQQNVNRYPVKESYETEQ